MLIRLMPLYIVPQQVEMQSDRAIRKSDDDYFDVEDLDSPKITKSEIKPGKRTFFISHKQANSQDQCYVLALELQDLGYDVWFDMQEKIINKVGMKEGVENSTFFLLFLNDGTLSRPYVAMELLHALELKKSIIVVFETDASRGAPLKADKESFDFSRALRTDVDSSLEKYDLLGLYEKGHLRAYEFKRGDRRQEMLKSLAGVAGPPPRPRTRRPILRKDAAVDFLIVCDTDTSEDQADTLRILIQNRGYTAVIGVTAEHHFKAVLLFLNGGTMLKASVKTCLYKAQELKQTIHVVYEKDGRHGSLLNADGAYRFDLAKADAPELGWIFDDVEAMPYERRHYQCESMLDELCRRTFDSGSLHNRNVQEAKLKEIKPGALIFGNKIDRGTFGDVYKGTLNTTGGPKVVAIKQLDNGSKEDVEHEAGILLRLLHENIVRVYGIVDDVKVSIVMEYIPGASLDTFLHKNEGVGTRQLLPEDWAASMILDLASVLEFLHSQSPRPIAHRDLKSSNILLRSDFRLVVIDFGSAKEKRSTNSIRATKSQGVVGTYAYLAPELVDEDESANISRLPSDVWAFGIVAMEIAAGVVPWKDQTDRKILKNLENKQSPMTVELSRAYGPTADLIARCMTINPKERPVAWEICRELEWIVDKLNGDPRQPRKNTLPATYSNVNKSDSAVKSFSLQSRGSRI